MDSQWTLNGSSLIHQSGARTLASSALVRAPHIYMVLPNQCTYRAMLCDFPALTKPINVATTPPHTVTHHIVMSGPLVYSRYMPLAPDRFRIAKAEFEHMREPRIICPFSSQWASPLHLLPHWITILSHTSTPSHADSQGALFSPKLTSSEHTIRFPSLRRTSQRQLLQGGLQGVFVYIDYILIASSMCEEHKKHLYALFGRLQKA
ncbi:uncharacterized protein LOC119570915 [Penaeus monodon]|uniref:uncharacterized protein LOC119570915 n=1 Tax=Penaeus monodon TaxID=6687 RepID=UPI0018A72093|nr:uncharacterized protein LOC119570915 [Penaeus monodon]